MPAVTKDKEAAPAPKKKRGRQGEGGGRPRFKIDYEQVHKLALMQCTQEEMASFLGCSVDTLHRDAKFRGIYKAGMDEGKSSLRRLQWKAAHAGNTTMLVWLGKQYLGQRDKAEHEHTGDIEFTFAIDRPPED